MTMGATELGGRIKSGEVSVAEAAKDALAQINAVEKDINSYVTVLDEDVIMKKAAEIQEGIAAGMYTGPLAGVPVAIKDNMCTKGILTTCSSRILSNFEPMYTAEAVLNLEKAGALIIGKTNMDEFAMGSTTETSYYGPTRNPWNTGHVPGGSSGGSCAAVAANECSSQQKYFDKSKSAIKYKYSCNKKIHYRTSGLEYCDSNKESHCP